MKNGKSLFCIGENDYTKYITVPSYKVNRSPVSIEWEDCNYVKHKVIKRWKVAGTFSLYFDDIESYKSFINDVNENTSGTDDINLTVYLNDCFEIYHGKFFLQMDLQNDMPFLGCHSHDTLSITIEEC